MYKVEIRNAENGKEDYFWWVIKSTNGREIGASTIMYTTKRSAYRVAKKLARSIGCELCYA